MGSGQGALPAVWHNIVRMLREGPARPASKNEKIAKIGGVLYRYWYYLNLLLINMLRYLAVFRS